MTEPDILNYPQLAARIFNVPLLIAPAKLEVILSVLGPKMSFEAPALRLSTHDITPAKKPYRVEEGVAIIPVRGTLLQRAMGVDALSGLCSYAGIRADFDQALNDRDVRGILFDIDSPGGEAAGVFDLADHIYNARGEKPITAIANEQATSAAYLIASSADQVIATRTAYTGSIGVVTSHLDVSKATDRRGIAVTYIYAGKHKIDGHPFAPLPDNVRANIQGNVNEIYDLFVETVARNRGREPDEVRATEAAVFMGGAANEFHLLDDVKTFDQTLKQATERPSVGVAVGPQLIIEETMMPNDKPAKTVTLTEEQLETMRAEDREKASNVSMAEGRKLERERVKAILRSEPAAGRHDLALHIACETDLSTEQAEAVLEAAPVVKKGPTLAERMAQEKTPNLGPDAAISEDQSKANTIVANFRAATGRKK